MAIKYKVVNKYNRKSISISLFGSYKVKEELSLKYKKDTIVRSKKGTLGIFLFNRKKDAIAWLTSDNIKDTIKYSHKILRVETLERCYTPKSISGLLRFNILRWYKTAANYGSTIPPKGTICCYRIKVLT